MKSRRSLFKLLALAGAGCFFLARQDSKAYFQGTSKNFNGKVFVDPDGSPPKSIGQVLQWNLERREKATWLSNYQGKKDKPPTRSKALRVSFIGHASWLYQVDNINILVDPVYAERASPLNNIGPKRATAVGVEFNDLPPIDYVLVTHNHYDHLDVETLKRLHQRDKPIFITPLANDVIIQDGIGEEKADIITLDWGDVSTMRSVKLHCEPCRHWSARGIFDRNKALWGCFVLETPAGKILHIGDTGYGTGVHFKCLKEKHGGFDLSIIPIGAYEPRWFMQDQHINPEEAVKVFQETNSKQAFASHWGTFKLTDEDRNAPPEALGVALKEAGVNADKFKVLEVGEVFKG